MLARAMNPTHSLVNLASTQASAIPHLTQTPSVTVAIGMIATLTAVVTMTRKTSMLMKIAARARTSNLPQSSHSLVSATQLKLSTALEMAANGTTVILAVAACMTRLISKLTTCVVRAKAM